MGPCLCSPIGIRLPLHLIFSDYIFILAVKMAHFLNFHTLLRQSNPLWENGLCLRGRYFQNTNVMPMITFVLLEGECHFIMVAKPSHKSQLFYWPCRDLLLGGHVTSKKKIIFISHLFSLLIFS